MLADSVKWVALFIALLCASACANHVASGAADPLVGHWRYADDRSTAEYFFNADGSFRGSVAREGRTIWTYAGEWTHTGNVLGYVYTKSSADWAPPGTKDRDMLIKIDRGSYIIQAGDGTRRKYLRVE